MCWVLVVTPVIPATQKAEIRRMAVRSQPRQIVPRDPISKIPSLKRGSGVAQGIGPEFKLQYHKKKKSDKPARHRNEDRGQGDVTHRWNLKSTEVMNVESERGSG
jgi:hypothetical protein